MTRQSLIFGLMFAFATNSATLFAQNPEAIQKVSPTLPKVVLLGDSIRLSYLATVKEELEGKALVVSPQANGGDTERTLKNLEAWAINQRPAVIHFNCGIHDTKKFAATGNYQVQPEQYEANLRKIVALLKEKTDAKLIFATSTPILDDRAAEVRQGKDYALLNDSIEKYNLIAKSVMTELQVPVNDLNQVLKDAPVPLEALIVADGVHMAPDAQKLLGKRVAEFVLQQMAVSGVQE